MVGKKRERGFEERLDRLGRQVVRAAAANEREAEAADSSPFLYARLRSRINAERERREEGERWLALLGVFRRAVPAMALVAVLAVVLFLSAGTGTTTPAGFNDEALFGASDAEVERVVFAERRPLSSDEVLATILNDDERETLR